jgi:replication initiation and membrane attachment protein DnaB
MNKIRIRQNYMDYNRVKDAFKNFVHTLVCESTDIDEGVEEDEVNDDIEMFCRQQGDREIAEINNSVSKFISSLSSRYEVHLYEMDDNDNAIEETAKHINTDNLNLALKKAAEFYRMAKNPQVNIFDNETGKYIAEWD